VTARHERLVALEGCSNFRDLGGYPTAAGGVTQWGRFYRSDGLQGVTPEDVEELRRRHLATIIDLRTDSELERWGRGLLRSEPIRFEHHSMIRLDGGESLAAPETDDLAARYLWYLQVGATHIAESVALLATPGVSPAVFHCAAGKDRTGVLAALILDAVGVEHDIVVADYVETAKHLEGILARLAANPPPGHIPAPSSRLTVEAATMQRFLAGLYEHHGGAARWMTDTSGDPELTGRLCAALLEP
jgi:protein-tyrosine phosphatase